MNRTLQRAWQGTKDIAGTWGIAAALIIAAVLATYQFVGPPPPDRIVLATGQAGGAYQAFGERYAAVLARDGIAVELRATAGSVENLALLAAGEADIGFVQSGLGGAAPPANVVALGSLYLEPLWLFLREGFVISDIGDLAGARVNVGAEGSGTRAVALTLLAASGVTTEEARLSALPATAAAAALAAGELDAVFLVASPESQAIAALLERPAAMPFDFDRTQAYARVFRFLSPVLLPEGVLDLDRNLPAQDIRMIAPSAMLAANAGLHPALTDLLLVAATELHGGDTLLSDAGDFPTPRYADLPLSDEASRHFEFGPPFLLRYLPFWAATLVDRLWVLLLPLIGLAIPAVKLVPPAYRWRVRRRLLRMYDELDALDPAQAPLGDGHDLARRLDALDVIDREVARLTVPRGYTDDVYKLRRDVDLVRRRLAVRPPRDEPPRPASP
jgi:TRAP transporter TAXI family solute receptor